MKLIKKVKKIKYFHVLAVVVSLMAINLSGCAFFQNAALVKPLKINADQGANNAQSFYMVVNPNETLENYMAQTKESVYQKMIAQTYKSYQLYPNTADSVDIEYPATAKYIGVYFLVDQDGDASATWSFLLPADTKKAMLDVENNAVELQK
ncbi:MULTISPECIES: hypothetical protein [Cysteiniphilum]|uniref:Type VI lipoprotein IgE-like C-terminal domain-containing protein n=1 Tax=Cysteiniphilum litorale TaxID=2056700 RepID=A0A8J2Z2X5_9GAMM|nr:MULTISPECIES: hypothetical protein [Cysteiniphilum]WHN65522.1 hypothetical protein NYP54_10880 [Cysteiniphilum sp. QT6929]GGF90964.1 hypothetical protein GCM10010995_05320 [Cysteiniphilum litorale]